MLRAFARIKTLAPGALLILAPRQPERFGEVERLARDDGLRRPCGDPICRSTPSRAPTSSCSTRSASWRSSISWRPRCSSAAASPITAGTTSSSRRSSASRSCSARTCRTSRRSPTRSWPTARRCRCSPSASSSEALRGAGRPIRCGGRGSARRRARWSKRIAAPRTRRSRSIAELLPPAGAGGVVRPFRLVH